MYKPSIIDVIVVKAMLVKGLQIPVEIADNIIELAEYWPHVTAEVTWGDERPNQVWSGESRENQFLVSSQAYINRYTVAYTNTTCYSSAHHP